MFRVFFVLSVSIYMSLGVTISKAEEVWKFAQSPWPPFVNEDGTGVLLDIVKATAKEAGVRAEIKLYPTKRAFHSVMTGKVDAIFGVMPPDKMELLKLVPLRMSDFTLAVVDINIYSKEPLDLKELHKKNIGVPLGLEELFNIKLSPSKCLECLFKMAAQGRLDGVIGIASLGEPIIQKYNLKLHAHYYGKKPIKVLLHNRISKETEERMGRAFSAIIGSAQFKGFLPAKHKKGIKVNYGKYKKDK